MPTMSRILLGCPMPIPKGALYSWAKLCDNQQSTVVLKEKKRVDKDTIIICTTLKCIYN